MSDCFTHYKNMLIPEQFMCKLTSNNNKPKNQNRSRNPMNTEKLFHTIYRTTVQLYLK